MINYIDFYETIKSCLNAVDFRQRNKALYYSNEKMSIIVEIQKSYFDNSYYINYGFMVNELHKENKNYKCNKCDITGRFVNDIDGQVKYDFILTDLNIDSFEKCVNDNVSDKLLPVINFGIEKYFEIFPKAVCSANMKLKDYLGL